MSGAWISEFPGCCGVSIVYGFGEDPDGRFYPSNTRVRNQLSFAVHGSDWKRSKPATQLVLTRRQRNAYRSLLKQYGFKRVTGWINSAHGGGRSRQFAVFMSFQDGMPAVRRDKDGL